MTVLLITSAVLSRIGNIRIYISYLTIGVNSLRKHQEMVSANVYHVSVIIIDEAIYKSKKSKIKNFVDVLFARRYDNEDMIVLKERDFI